MKFKKIWKIGLILGSTIPFTSLVSCACANVETIVDFKMEALDHLNQIKNNISQVQYSHFVKQINNTETKQGIGEIIKSLPSFKRLYNELLDSFNNTKPVIINKNNFSDYISKITTLEDLSKTKSAFNSTLNKIQKAIQSINSLSSASFETSKIKEYSINLIDKWDSLPVYNINDEKIVLLTRELISKLENTYAQITQIKNKLEPLNDPTLDSEIQDIQNELPNLNINSNLDEFNQKITILDQKVNNLKDKKDKEAEETTNKESTEDDKTKQDNHDSDSSSSVSDSDTIDEKEPKNEESTTDKGEKETDLDGSVDNSGDAAHSSENNHDSSENEDTDSKSADNTDIEGKENENSDPSSQPTTDKDDATDSSDSSTSDSVNSDETKEKDDQENSSNNPDVNSTSETTDTNSSSETSDQSSNGEKETSDQEDNETNTHSSDTESENANQGDNENSNPDETTNNTPTTPTEPKILDKTEINNYYETHPEVHRYGESNYDDSLKFDKNIDYVKNILGRTVSLFFRYTDETFSGGTAWLLDYIKTGAPHENKYKLFLATNYHVAIELFADDDYDIYKQPNKLAQKHMKEFVVSFNHKYDDSLKDSIWTKKLRSDYVHVRLKPSKMARTFFLAQNFMDKAVVDVDKNYYADFAVLEWDVDLDNLLAPSDLALSNPDTSSHVGAYEYSQASIEWKLLTDHLKNGIKLMEENKARLTHNDKVVNLDKTSDYPYATVGVDSLWYARNELLGAKGFERYKNIYADSDIIYKKLDTDEKINNMSKYINETLPNSKYNPFSYLYSAGYPILGIRITTQVTVPAAANNLQGYKNYSVDRNLISASFDLNATASADHGLKFNNEAQSLYYGTAYEFLGFNPVIGGQSGSMVIDEQGLTVGILWGTYGDIPFLDNNNKQVRLYRHAFAPLIQNFQFNGEHLMNNSDGSQTRKPFNVRRYNLIDGTNKEIYKYQRDSFRERLIKIYGDQYQSSFLFKKIKTSE
ncbi:hypothetical protein H9M94_00485 [Mycoplasma sp. Pen4]|uniref:MIP family Ig-specific serine endopeptidase n=1 Tax=Mycoplasma sp. Pen4 TaxID=640330 RepID=UPI00165428F5|nr:hypothetical protein [Mycoplasma sp. Pen4]QNM93741.1 hypothetical protein H9M94_00485 [Mycoplasma sp. Pen4]